MLSHVVRVLTPALLGAEMNQEAVGWTLRVGPRLLASLEEKIEPDNKQGQHQGRR